MGTQASSNIMFLCEIWVYRGNANTIGYVWGLCLKILRDVDHSDIISLAQEALDFWFRRHDCQKPPVTTKRGLMHRDLSELWVLSNSLWQWNGLEDKGTATCVHVDCASPLFQQPGQVFARSPDGTRLIRFKPGQNNSTTLEIWRNICRCWN